MTLKCTVCAACVHDRLSDLAFSYMPDLYMYVH